MASNTSAHKKGTADQAAAKATGMPASSRMTLPKGTHKQTPSQVAERVVQDAVPQTAFEILGNLFGRNPVLVLSVCGVLIVIEVLVIARYVGDLGSDPFEAKYYNRARVVSRDLDRKAVEQIPTDSLASGVHNPIEDVFSSESEGRPGTTNTDQRVKHNGPDARPAAVEEAIKQAHELKSE